MSTSITSRGLSKLLSNGTPAEEGARLARALLANESTDWDDLAVDYRGMSFDMMGIDFFYGFLEQIATARPDLLECARRVKWLLSYSGLDDVVAAYVAGFRPRAPAAAAA